MLILTSFPALFLCSNYAETIFKSNTRSQDLFLNLNFTLKDLESGLRFSICLNCESEAVVHKDCRELRVFPEMCSVCHRRKQFQQNNEYILFSVFTCIVSSQFVSLGL